MRKPILVAVGLALLALPTVIGFPGLSAAGAVAMGLFLMAAIFWVGEPIPIYATSMLVILLQLLLLSASSPFVQAFGFPYGAADAPKAEVFTSTLANPILILFLGGFMLASAAVRYGLEKNLVRVFLGPFTGSPGLLLFGVMATTAALSAFMSNTATTAMMITIVLPLLAKLQADDPLRVALALAIPIGANLGGIATPIGTPPNALALAALAEQGMPVAFTTWMLMAAPLALVSVGVAWLVLRVMYPARARSVEVDLAGSFDRSRPAVLLYGIGGLTVLLWSTEALHKIPTSVVAFVPVALLPAFGVIGVKEIRALSWEVLWLVAGGISLGISLRESGLAAWLVGLVDWAALGPVAALAAFLVLAVVMANFLSHTVTASLLVPIAVSLGTSGILPGMGAAAAVAVGIAVASSFGMSLPISTPPNAIAISTGVVTTAQMARVGAVMAVFGLAACQVLAVFFWPLFFR